MALADYDVNFCPGGIDEITTKDLNEYCILPPHAIEDEDVVNSLIYDDIRVGEREGEGLNLLTTASLQLSSVAGFEESADSLSKFHAENDGAVLSKSNPELASIKEVKEKDLQENIELSQESLICPTNHDLRITQDTGYPSSVNQSNFKIIVKEYQALEGLKKSNFSEEGEDTQSCPSRPRLPDLVLKTNSRESHLLLSQPDASVAHMQMPTSNSIMLSLMSKTGTILPALTPSFPPAFPMPSHSMEQSAVSTFSSHEETLNTDCTSIPVLNSDCENSNDALLRDMIASPTTRSSLSIGSVPRQDLSSVCVPPACEKPAPQLKPSVASKLDREIGCQCQHNDGKPCWTFFQEEHLRKERKHHLEMKKESLDLVILAKVAANINREEQTLRRPSKLRQRSRINYLHEGRQICRETFLFIHGICKSRLTALISHYKSKGLTNRVHKNVKSIPKHALSEEDTNNMLNFVKDYANKHCASSCGGKLGGKTEGGLLIMSKDQSKLFVHHKYKAWCSLNSLRAVSLRSFQSLWNRHLPYIVVVRGSNKCSVRDKESTEDLSETEDQVNDIHGDVENADGSNICETSENLQAQPHIEDQGEPLFVSRGTSIDFLQLKSKKRKMPSILGGKQLIQTPEDKVDGTAASQPAHSVLPSNISAAYQTSLTSCSTHGPKSTISDTLPPSEIRVTIVPSTNPMRLENHSTSVSDDPLLLASVSQPQQLPLPKNILTDSEPCLDGINEPENHLLFPHGNTLQSLPISDALPVPGLSSHLQSQPLFLSPLDQASQLTGLASMQTSESLTLLPQTHDLSIPTEVPSLADYQPMLLSQTGGALNLEQTPDWHPWTPFTSL